MTIEQMLPESVPIRQTIEDAARVRREHPTLPTDNAKNPNYLANGERLIALDCEIAQMYNITYRH